MTEPTTTPTTTDADILKLKSQYENLLSDCAEQEELLKQPTESRPGFTLKDEQVSDLKLGALVEFLMPLEGPAATNETIKANFLFQIYFLSKYRQALTAAEKEALEFLENYKSEVAKAKLQVASAQDIAAVQRATQANPLFRT